MSNIFENMSRDELQSYISQLEQEAEGFRAQNLALDMARGKPSQEQTDLSRPLLDELTSVVSLTDEDVDAANYGAPLGLPSARKLGAQMLGCAADQIMAMDSSSLSLMYDVIQTGFNFGFGGEEPWSKQGTVRFLCPAPGYDRHFAITESFGIQNVAVPMTEHGPDMVRVRELVENDPHIKGIWCVPKYANPTGITYSDDVVAQLAELKPAAPDFRIFWDNAYAVHDLEQPGDELANIFEALAEQGQHNRIFAFASTAKITFPGSGIAWLVAGPDDFKALTKAFSIHRVCPNKLNQLAHVCYLKDMTGIRAHMALHAQILKPRFELVERKLSRGLTPLGISSWTHPHGGYFVSFESLPGCAKAIVALAQELGVKLTPAGATWPYGQDPKDSNIRIAPTYPSVDELSQALDVFILCVKLISARHILEGKPLM